MAEVKLKVQNDTKRRSTQLLWCVPLTCLMKSMLIPQSWYWFRTKMQTDWGSRYMSLSLRYKKWILHYQQYWHCCHCIGQHSGSWRHIAQQSGTRKWHWRYLLSLHLELMSGTKCLHSSWRFSYTDPIQMCCEITLSYNLNGRTLKLPACAAREKWVEEGYTCFNKTYFNLFWQVE